MKNQKLIAGILTGILAVSSFTLAGCGGKEESKASSLPSQTEETTEAPKELELPISSDEALKKGKDELYDMFYDAGFKSTDTEPLNDLDSSSDKQNDTISAVLVNGNETFSKGDKMLSNVKILIRYHCVKEASIPFDIDMAIEYEKGITKELNYEDVITQFEKEGFNNISTRTAEDNSKTENTVKEISVDGKNLADTFTSYYPIDAKVVITYYTKQGQAATQAPAKPESKTESKADDSGSSNGSFKETMDSYEAFFDEYIAFMKKYKENPSDLTLLGEYSEMMSKYSDYMDKMREIDTGSLSEADLAYYTEVHTRITNKLAEVY